MKASMSGALACLAVVFSATWSSVAPAADESRVSKFGEYSGYSKALYDGWVRTSQYVTVRDGTKLAVDIVHPATNGKATTDRLPVIWTHTRYQRSNARDGKLNTIVDRSPLLQLLLHHGYVVAVVDVRGSGASFGTWDGSFSPKETRDAYDLTEWFAAQPWSTGQIGMFGGSYLGATQYMAASQAPPHLKAIFPQKAPCDRYALLYPGGIFRNDFSNAWGKNVKELDTHLRASRVDEDQTGALLEAAVKEHQGNRGALEMTIDSPFRDSLDPKTKEPTWLGRSTFGHLDEIKKSKIAIYHLGGWFDIASRDTVVAYDNLDNPQKMVIGPWTHMQDHELDFGAEHLRWFDYWLKGVDNGVMKETPIHYYTLGNPKAPGWRATAQWPLRNQQPTAYYLHAGPTKSIKSANDGGLAPVPPAEPAASDAYTVDYTTTSGRPSRWSSGYGLGGKEFNYSYMKPLDEKGLTYSTEPLAADLEVTGHPVTHLWVSSTAKDGDFFAYLEDVDPSGVSHYVTEGCLRASNRALHNAPYQYLGLPYHRCYAADAVPLPGEPVELVFDLQPTSILFHKGHRIRLTIACADKDNTLTPELTPAPKVEVHRGKKRASYVVLPVIPANVMWDGVDTARPRR
jgi:putative CocE/NonD family hydrolase